jgi:hypothetical protein
MSNIQDQLNNKEQTENTPTVNEWANLNYAKIPDVAEEELTLHSYVILQGDFGEYMLCHVSDKDGNKFNVSTGSVLIMDKVIASKDKLPQGAKFIVRQSRNERTYYDVV